MENNRQHLIISEALINLRNFRWCGVVCCFALSSILGETIKIHYSHRGEIANKLIFSPKIYPRTISQNSDDKTIHLFL